MWVATKWDFYLFIYLFFFFFWGGHVWSTLRLRLKLGIVKEVGYKFKYFWDMFDTYILRKGC